MASTAGDEPSSAATAVVPQAVATNAKMMVATSREDCQGLKDLLRKEEATTMVVVIAKNPAPPPKSTPASMHPLLADAACEGNWEELNYLLMNREDREIPSKKFLDKLPAHSSGNGTNGSPAMEQDVEKGLDDAASLLKGVTVAGDTALHLVAANGNDGSFLNCANLIHGKEIKLLYQHNDKGDTPLHCAVRAGNFRMVSRLVALARDDNRAEELLRKENRRKETALHEAVWIGNNRIVKDLLKDDPVLAGYPKKGTSPLYLAILLKQVKIAETLLDRSTEENLSYLGPAGQNALHAAVMRGSVLTRKMLEWNKNLTTQRDENGSTPLHFAAGLGETEFSRVSRAVAKKLLGRNKDLTTGSNENGSIPKAFAARLHLGSVCSQVFEANRSALYQQDNGGFSPIHVAAFVGAWQTIDMFVKKCGSSAGLRDAKGRTFLHVAVEKRQKRIVVYACRTQSLRRILNMQDNDGNTALHLAVQACSIQMFCPLFGNRQVHLSLTNEKGQTPLDIARYKVPPGLFNNQNSESLIRYALSFAGAENGASRKDHFAENYEDMHGLKSDFENKELKNIKDLTQSRTVGSVLIATVAFGATFALPGGYRADDHNYAGTPTLAGRYAFDAFMMANTLAFLFSSLATICLMRAGSPTFNRQSRKANAGIVFNLIEISVTCLITAFALGVFVVLSPVAYKTAVAICVMSSVIVLCNKAEFCLKWAFLLPSFCTRMGLFWTIWLYTTLVVANLLFECWPFILIFIWATYGRSHHISKVETLAQPPVPLT